MFYELTFVEGPVSPSVAYFGGDPYLPASIPWPTDSSGAPLMHLATFPASTLNRYIPALGLQEDLVVSIFSPYSTADDSYIDKAMNEGGVAVAYKPAHTARDGYGTPIAPHRLINVVNNAADDSEDNGTAKIAGIPAWLQDEEVRNGMIYVLQVNNSRLNKAAPTHKSILVGGTGYLLLRMGICGEDHAAGVFVIQTS